MKPEHERLKQILAEAAAQPTSAERTAYLEAACQGEVALRQAVETLLQAHDEAGDFLQEPVIVRCEDPAEAIVGVVIGRYKLLEEIGQGGFGRVFMAEQQEPVRRKVALKIIKAGMDTREVIARFEAERQALALMEHPNIARVLDAGATDTGRPYFVMELVKGVPVTTYCDQNQLATEERLHLFLKVCQAVQHAHQKGVIHRDLKPTNVLVTVVDGEAVPKVIDFGIAKAIGQELTARTLFTRFQELIGTPAYMSPEQAALSGVDVDTRSDIYSLGVLLYELLTGATPFDQATLARAGLDEIRRLIRETEPPKPSTRLRTQLAGTRPTAPTRDRDGAESVPTPLRNAQEVRQLIRLIQGDLDWIVMKALDKDRARRYETATALADDVRRHLHHELVLARPPSAAYRFRKVVRRHRVLVMAGAVVLTALIAGLLLATAGFIRARSERNRAVAAEQQAEEGRREAVQQRQHAEASLRRAEFQAARDFFARDEAARGLSLLAARLRAEPSDLIATEWLMNELTHRNLALPVTEALTHEAGVSSARFSPDGHRVLAAVRNNSARIWNVATGQPVTPPLRHDPGLVRLGELSAAVHPLVAEFDPDGRRVVTGSMDTTARIWDAFTGMPVSSPLPHPAEVTCVKFSPDGRQFVTGCKDGAVRLWNSATGEPVRALVGHTQWVNTVEFSPDGRWLVTASDDQTARVWEVASGQPVGPPRRHQKEVRHAVFSPDGRRLATAPGDGKARLWDTQTGEPLGQTLAHGDAVLRVCFSPDGLLLATACWDKAARLWNGLTGEPVGQPLRHEDVVRDVQFSPEGRRLATASRDKTARVWEVRTQEPLTEPMRHHDAVWTAEFSPDGQRLLTGSADRTAQLWDVRPGRALVRVLPHRMRVTGVDWAPDGRRVLGVSPRRVHVWEVDTGAACEGPVFARQQGVNRARFSPDGQRLVVASEDGTATIWDGRGQQPLTPPLKHSGPVLHAEFSPDGRLVVTASADRTARLWDSVSGQPAGPALPHDDSVRTARFSPDTKTVVTASADKSARLWHVATGQLVTAPLRHENLVVWAEFSPSGRQVVTASSDQSARVWDAASGNPLSPPLQHLGAVSSARFSPDGVWVVTASADETARIWDWRSGAQVGMPLRHHGRLNWAAFSPDGQRVVTASVDRTAGLWDARTGFPLSTGLRHLGLVEHVQFSPDGRWIAAASFEYAVRVWEIVLARSPAPDWLPELAEAVAGERLSEQGVAVDVAPGQFLQLKARLQTLSVEDDYARWVRWFLADRSTRTVSPAARHSAPEIATRVIGQ